MKQMSEDNQEMMDEGEKPVETFSGEVIWFSGVKGFGFIAWEKYDVPQKDMFCHFSDVIIEGYKTLFKGQKVSFQIGANKNGDPKAVCVQVLKS
jgi:cold shock protein